MTRLNFYLSDAQITALRAMAEKTGLSVSELIRRAVDLMLAKPEKGKGKP